MDIYGFMSVDVPTYMPQALLVVRKHAKCLSKKPRVCRGSNRSRSSSCFFLPFYGCDGGRRSSIMSLSLLLIHCLSSGGAVGFDTQCQQRASSENTTGTCIHRGARGTAMTRCQGCKTHKTLPTASSTTLLGLNRATQQCFDDSKFLLVLINVFVP